MEREKYIQSLKEQYLFMADCGFELPTGWQLFTAKLCAAVAELYEQAGLDVDFHPNEIVNDDDNYVVNYRFTENDERYEQIHLQVDKAVREYVEKSRTACIMCGEQGSLHKAPNGNYGIYRWICLTPLCENCWPKAVEKFAKLEEYANQHFDALGGNI